MQSNNKPSLNMIGNPAKAPIRYMQNGMLVYISHVLHFSSDFVRGFLYKCPESTKFFQRKSFYRRFFSIQKGRECVEIKENFESKDWKIIMK